jgi:hypothetical protein
MVKQIIIRWPIISMQALSVSYPPTAPLVISVGG